MLMQKYLKWIYLLMLSLIWGSSFILIKKGLVGLTPYQVGALRIVLTSIFLFSIGFKSLKEIQKTDWKWIAWSGLLGSGYPPFFFAKAQEHLDSAVASILNSLVPFFTLLSGLFFGFAIKRKQVLGILIGFVGCVLLILTGASISSNQNYWYSILIIVSTIGYGFNLNIIKKHLKGVSALAITTGNFVLLFLPALIILYVSGFFDVILQSKAMQQSLLYITVLSLFGTAFAKVLFNKLVQVASPVFSASVTYLMPIVAVMWGFLDGESFHVLQMVGGAVIVFGVYISNKGK